MDIRQTTPIYSYRFDGGLVMELRIKLNDSDSALLQRIIDTATTAGYLCSKQDAFRVLLYIGANASQHYQEPDLLRVIRQELGE